MDRFYPSTVISQGKTLITAHSGCEGTEPGSKENILAALSSGAEMLEVDVRKSGDLLYLSHDQCDTPEKCTTLDFVFHLLGQNPYVRINCDVKTPGLIAPVMALAKKYGVEKAVVFTGECNLEHEEIKNLGGELWYSMWPGRGELYQEMEKAVAFCREISCPVINPHYSMITDETFSLLEENGIRFSAWTADTEEEIRRLLELKVVNITTRKPILALKLREEIQGKIY